jgi:sphingomyelin phosphodiesterase
LQAAKTQVQWLLASTAFTNKSCPLCTAILQVAKFLSLAAPEQGPPFFVFLCQQFKLSSACNTTFSATTLGPVLTQVLANADVVGYDGQVRTVAGISLSPRRCLLRSGTIVFPWLQLICQNFFSSACPLPPTPPLNLTDWFAKPKPTPLRPPRKPSGKRLKVLHLSDFHIDPRAFRKFSSWDTEPRVATFHSFCLYPTLRFFSLHVICSTRILRLRDGVRGELHVGHVLSYE